ncbi:LysE family translocator [Desulfobacula phenolica]|uniref:Threonine/homoserine/homoserine lactone efflux protein n=1 Tax=Desulfobacula phenolica TaxID=90732 RepID=A0A1H2DYS3_9BACT|nr:LysE family translocator [Desulfobacula phenolica]SDT88020.1 Threonine/homoserine/homoserine lactone efflux protein [Desulfobacula phenolica]
MSLENWVLFVTVCLIASMTPGPVILSVITHSLNHGTKNSIPIILGILSGLFLLSLMAVMGLGVLLESSKTMFIWLQYFGAAYLCFIGIKTFKSKAFFSTESCLEKQKESPIKLYLQGVGVSVANPKALGFFSALFLPFINLDCNVYSQFAVLLLTLLGCSVFSLFFYSIGAQIISPAIKKYTKAFNKITGSCFIGFSVMLVTSNKP